MPSSPRCALATLLPPLGALAVLAASSACAGPQTAPSRTAAVAPTGARSSTTSVAVIALSDFHGWLRPLKPRRQPHYYGGIGHLAGLLKGRERLDGASAVLVDNGDMWTGQTEATLLRGEPVVSVYNELGFAAVNTANHEFDFGTEVLRARVAQARFPFLGANIYYKGRDQRPEYVQPWTVVTRNDVKVGVLGLCYIDTPKTTRAENVADLEFRGYAETLKRELPALRETGAEVIVVLLHDDVQRAAEVFTTHPELKVDLVVAGQNHKKERTEVNGIPIVNPGPFGRSYTRFDVHLDRETRRVVSVTHETVDVTGKVDAPPFPAHSAVAEIVEAARKASESMTTQRVGELGLPLPVGTFDASPFGHFVVDSWLQAFPESDFAIVNRGGLRQDVESGTISMGDLMGALPFENNILKVKLTGAELKTQLAIDNPVVGGLSWTYREQNGQRTVVQVNDRNGRPLSDAKTYEVLIIDFLYTGGDGFTFQALDPAPIDTGISWREPLIRALRRAEDTSKPLVPAGAKQTRATVAP